MARVKCFAATEEINSKLVKNKSKAFPDGLTAEMDRGPNNLSVSLNVMMKS